MRRLVHDTYDQPPLPKQLGVVDTLDGRVQLLAPEPIRVVWQDFQYEKNKIDDFVFVLRGVQPYHGMAEDDLLLVRTREAIRRLNELTRKAAERG